MEKGIYFAMGLHNHQPVGNFDFVIERAYQMCYKPLIEFFLEHPKFPFSIHFSGYLLLWLERNYPEYFDTLRELSERGQIEFLSGGFYEPILPIIPDADKIAQVRKLNDYIYNKFGQKPKGMWLAERVWEPHLVKFIAEAGIEYIIVDDAHFLSVGLKEEDLFGYYLMEEQGYTVSVFPISMKLRYIIPFAEPQETISYLDRFVSFEKDKIAVLFDDGEKFGLWPDTYKTVYEDKWLERFWNTLQENSSLVTPVNFSEYMQKFPPLGRIYLPTASYREMMEWVLFPESQLILEEFTEKIKNEGNWERYAPFVKGGFWRNFLAKYDESNHMHKKMLYVRKKIDGIKDDKVKELALEEIWQGQANDAYWHGIFGGLYLPHLRTAIYEHIIKAENLIDKYHNNCEVNSKVLDMDCDGREEVIVESKDFNLYFSPSFGGSLLEWDFKPKFYNLTDVITRRKEAYHNKLFEIKEENVEGKSIHERWTVKEKGLEKLIFYDKHRRVSFVEKFYKEEPSIDAFWKDEDDYILSTYYERFSYKDEKDDDKGVFIFYKEFPNFILEKSFIVYKDEPILEVIYKIRNTSQENLITKFSWELNLNFLAPDHPDYYFYIPEKEEKYVLSSIGVEEVDQWKIISGIGIEFSCELESKIKFYRYPIETVSLSESGFERVYQGSGLIHLYDLNIPSEEIWQSKVRFEVK